MLNAIRTEIGHSLRRLGRVPGVSLVAVATLALAIGAHTTVVSLLNATTFRTVVADAPKRLVALSAHDDKSSRPGLLHQQTLAAFLASQRAFSSMSLYSGGAVLRTETPDGAREVVAEGVTPEYLQVVGVRLAEGRWLTDDDGEGAAAPVVVISDRLRRRAYGDGRAAVGERITIDGAEVTIVGVTAPGFFGLQIDAGVDLFLPLTFVRGRAGDRPGVVRAPHVIGRLAPGVSFEEARAEVLARWPAIHADTAGAATSGQRQAAQDLRFEVEPISTGFSSMRRQWSTAFIVLVGLTTLLLAIAAVNLIGLMSARAIARQHEIAVALMLGAGRWRLVRQWATDGLLLAMAGLAVGLPLAWWASGVLEATLTVARTVPLQRPMTPDASVVAVAVVAALLVGVAMGVLPAWRAVNRPVADVVRQGRGVARALGRSGRLVLVTQVALSLILVAGAGLFAGMLSHLRANDAQFRDEPVVWTRLARTPGQRGRVLGPSYFHGLVERLKAIPGADSVAMSAYFPAYLGYRGELSRDRFASGAGEEAPSVSGLTEYTTPDFFGTVGIAELAGRDFTWADDGDRPAVAIVSASLARALFPDGEAVGRRLFLGEAAKAEELEIVGVVADAPIGSIREPRLPVVFRPMMQALARAQWPMTHVRVRGDVAAVQAAYRGVVEAQGEHYVPAVFTLQEWLDSALLQERLIVSVSMAAAGLAVLLAGLGIYGGLAYAVTSRRRELGVRMALGASRGGVAGMVVRDSLALAVPGIVIGVPAALAGARIVRAELYGVTATDPATFGGAVAVLLAGGVLAAVVPALRASAVDPARALRQD
ncbi:MAG: ABC transporter permease [Acidobacteriota bacterium]